MHRYKESEQIKQGYRIKNAEITSVDLSMADHGCLTFDICLSSNGWGVCYEGYCLGKSYLGADDKFFEGSSSGIESIMMIMDTIGVSKLSSLIGNILKDKWFDYESFFKEEP